MGRLISSRRLAAALALGAVLASGCRAPEPSKQAADVSVRVLGATLSRNASSTTTSIPAAVLPPTVPTSTTIEPAVAGITITSSSDPRIAPALAAIHVDWQRLLPGWTLSIQGSRAGYQGGTFPDERRIEIYVRASSTVTQLTHVIAHELGHAVDVTYFDAATRATFQVMRGRTADFAWRVTAGASDFSSGAGDWAESYSWVVTGGLGAWSSRLGAPPDAAAEMAIIDLVRQRSAT